MPRSRGTTLGDCALGHANGRFTALVTVCMFVPLRSTFVVISALTASSVAPAQVNPATQPLPPEWFQIPMPFP